MDLLSIPIQYDGQLILNEGSQPSYMNGKFTIVHVPCTSKLHLLKKHIYRAIGANPKLYHISLICFYEVKSVPMLWRLDSDEVCSAFLYESQKETIMLYVEKELREDGTSSQATEASAQMERPQIDDVPVSNPIDITLTPSFSSQVSNRSMDAHDYNMRSPLGELRDIPEAENELDDQVEDDSDDPDYETMGSCESSSSDSSDDEVQPEITYGQPSQMGVGVIMQANLQDMSWVDRLVANNEFVQFVTTAREWNKDDNFDGPLDNIFVTRDFQVPPGLAVGMIFTDKWDAICAVGSWAINNNVSHKHTVSNTKKLTMVCTHANNPTRPCKWRLHASTGKGLSGRWKIASLGGPHTCASTILQGSHQQCTSKFIARFIVPSIRTHMDLKPKEIIGRVEAKFNVRISYMKAWDARQKAIKAVFGGWDDSYKTLYRFMEAIVMCMPESVYVVQHTTHGRFQRLFWSFGPSIQGWIHCRPVLSLDGTFLLGKHRGTLLIGVGIDANNGLYPLAFAVVESESNDSWEWFLITLRDRIGPIKQRRDLAIISDKHSGLLRGIATVMPWVRHRHCLRHLRENFKKAARALHIDCIDLICDKMYSAGSTDDADSFTRYMNEIFQINEQAHKWLLDRDPILWALICDKGARYGTMTTNVSESFNSVLKRARGLPIQALVTATYYNSIGIFIRRREESMHMQGQFAPRPTAQIQGFVRDGRMLATPIRVNRTEYQVTDSVNNIYRIDVRSQGVWRCSCVRPVLYHIPCPHVMAVLEYARGSYEDQVSKYYTVDAFRSAYSVDFHTIPDARQWPDYDVARGVIELIPPVNIRRAGRPRASRFRNTMDDSRVSTARCSACKQIGHYRTTCPTNPDNRRYDCFYFSSNSSFFMYLLMLCETDDHSMEDLPPGCGSQGASAGSDAMYPICFSN